MKKIIIIVLVSLLSATTLLSDEYKSYQYSRQQSEYFSIAFNSQSNEIEITAPQASTRLSIKGNRNDFVIQNGAVKLGALDIFRADKLIIDSNYFYYDKITDSRIESDEQITKVIFLTSASQTTVDRFKKGNRFDFSGRILIDSSQFIRGMVMSIIGDIEINGEVNKDVISLFGEIEVSSSAVIRGNIFSLIDKIDFDKNASLYGEIYQFNKKGRRSISRYLQAGKEIKISGNMSYNRIDGFKPAATFGYNSIDSVYPALDLELGYAFASERLRFKAGLEKLILRDREFSVSSEYYQKLTSLDNYIMANTENSLFALLFNRDYKDFYEVKGGNIFGEIRLYDRLYYQTGFEFYEMTWLPAHRNLWSLFDNDELFDLNYSSLTDNERLAAAYESDGTKIGSWVHHLEFNTMTDKSNPFSHSYWDIKADHEWAVDMFNSDINYNRMQLTIKRYHKLSRNSSIHWRGITATSDGYLLYVKKYYLGGIGTLHGYDLKEFYGHHFLLSNFEYRQNIYTDQVALALGWDLGGIDIENQQLQKEFKFKHSLNVSFNIANQLKLIAAKRLDRSYDNDLKFYFRFAQNF